MSKKRTIQRAAQENAERAIASQTVAPTRNAFSIMIAFDPAQPQTANLNVMPIGGDRNGSAHIDDVIMAMRMGYEQALMQKGAWLLQQELAAQHAVSGRNGEQEGSAPAA